MRREHGIMTSEVVPINMCAAQESLDQDSTPNVLHKPQETWFTRKLRVGATLRPPRLTAACYSDGHAPRQISTDISQMESDPTVLVQRN